MRCTAVMLALLVLLAFGAGGCRGKPPPAAEPQKPRPADSAPAPAGQASEPTDREDYVAREPVRPPGFFGVGVGPSHGAREPDRDTRPPATPRPKPVAKSRPKPVKRPPRVPLTPDKQAENKLKLARLYIANAAAARAADKRRQLRAKAAGILKEILSKYGKSPAAKDAGELLGALEAGR